jgi:hypothetical protein
MTAFGSFKIRRLKSRLKASIPFVQTTPHILYNILHFVVFTAASIQLKKPSVARRASRSPMPWGPLAAGGKKLINQMAGEAE